MFLNRIVDACVFKVQNTGINEHGIVDVLYKCTIKDIRNNVLTCESNQVRN